MNRFTLLVLLFTCAFLMLSSLGMLILWFSTDVEKLVKHYPVYNLNKKKYDFHVNRPENWASIEDISLYARWAVVVSEDWAFYDHSGIDLKQLRLVIDETLQQGEFVRGASTITQQVIKNTILSPDKTLWRKFREIILALKLENHLSKDKILEIYLNIVELGKDVYGIKAAAKYYFKKCPRNLTAREGAFLAMLLPSPVKYMTSFNKKALTSYAREVIDSILVKLRQAKIYDEKTRVNESSKLFYWEEPPVFMNNLNALDTHRQQL